METLKKLKSFLKKDETPNKKKEETITISKDKLEQVLESLDASYHLYEMEEKNTIEFIRDDLMYGDPENQRHGGYLLSTMGEWKLGSAALIELKDLINSHLKYERQNPQHKGGLVWN